MKFLKKLFGITEARPHRGDTRITYWKSATGWSWHCQDGNNEVVCSSNQGYETAAACLAGVRNASEAMNGALDRGNLVLRELSYANETP